MPSPDHLDRLDIRNLAKADPREVQAMLRDAEAGLQRGVDLSALKARREHEHKWIIVAQFVLGEKTLAEMAERRLMVANMIARGEDIPDDAGGAVAMPMGEDNLIWSEGPGCVKCGAHWEHPELGYGFKCPVSDEDWTQQRNIQAQAIAASHQENLGRLVGKQLRAMEKAGEHSPLLDQINGTKEESDVPEN